MKRKIVAKENEKGLWRIVLREKEN